jgi:hypothetical protein
MPYLRPVPVLSWCLWLEAGGKGVALSAKGLKIVVAARSEGEAQSQRNWYPHSPPSETRCCHPVAPGGGWETRGVPPVSLVHPCSPRASDLRPGYACLQIGVGVETLPNPDRHIDPFVDQIDPPIRHDTLETQEWMGGEEGRH